MSIDQLVRAKSGVPVLTDFQSTIGTPILVDSSTGDLYSVTSGDVVTKSAQASQAALTLGTMATQNANNVAITGGAVSGTSLTGSLTGNASTATTLQTARTINGTSFDGSANITVTAAAGTLTGTTLAANVVNSSLHGTLTAGSSSVLNPAALSTKTAQAHGLSGTPDFYQTYIECLSAELGYSVGDRVGNTDLNGATGWMVEFDATNITTITSNTNIAVINKTTPAGTVAITLAKWKVVAVPYKLN